MREEIEARPAALLFIGLVVGLIAFSAPLALAGLAACVIWIRGPGRKGLLVGAFLLGLILSPRAPRTLSEAIYVRGIGTVSSVPVLYPDFQVLDLQIQDRRLVITAPQGIPLMLGDEVRVAGIAKPVENVPGVRRAVFADGRMKPDAVTIVREGSWIAHLADAWRRSFASYLQRNLSAKNADLVDGLCFNARAMVDPQTRQELANSGTIHILSASGLQVFVFGVLVSLTLRVFPVSRSIQIAVLGGLLVVYALAAGLQPQIVRAAAMTLLGMSAYLVRRDPDALSALAVAGFLYLLWMPAAIYGMAFQLSFVTVGAIALFYRPSRSKREGWKKEIIRLTNDFLRLSGIVVLAAEPLVAYYLGVISVVSVFANLSICWSLPLIVGAAFFGHGVCWVLPMIGDAMATNVLSPLARWIYAVIDGVGGDPSVVHLPAFSPLWLVAFYWAWLMTYRRRVVQP